jgi:hypothetical protein
MVAPKTLPQRERELQDLMLSPQGLAELARLEGLYADLGEWRSSRSVITNIIIHERTVGLIHV